LIHVEEFEQLKADAEKWRVLPEWMKLGHCMKLNEYESDKSLMKDAELGALARKMPTGWYIWHHESGWNYTSTRKSAPPPFEMSGTAATPEEAFRAALGEHEKSDPLPFQLVRFNFKGVAEVEICRNCGNKFIKCGWEFMGQCSANSE